jgi:di- and tripeptidase
VEYRTVSANPRCAAECHEAVTFLRKRCSAFGATTTVLHAGDNLNPILLAKFQASHENNNRKSLLFYGHYDVVDAEPQSDNWHGDPFSLVPLNGYLYGRGATDNKGPILAAIHAAADLAQQGKLSCNITFLLEGDEEAGSRGFRDTIRAHHDEIGPVDYILLSNSYWLDDHIPCLTFGMRGVVHASISVSNNRPDLHSGMDGKSVQHEPLKDLTVLLSALIGSTGTKIMIPGFYDSVDDLTEAEMQTYNTLTSALVPGHPEIKNPKEFSQSLIQRWRYPNLTVHRIEVPEAKTAVTISGTAKATLSIRIVPSQSAEDVASSLKQYLHDTFTKLKSTCILTVSITSRADPWLGKTQSPIYQALKEAVVDVWSPSSSAIGGRSFTHSGAGTPDTTHQKRPPHRRASSLASHGTFTAENTPHEPLFIREGGSIPAISFLEREFDAPAAMFPMGQASDNAHLDNERIRVENLYKGREVLKRVFARL